MADWRVALFFEYGFEVGYLLVDFFLDAFAFLACLLFVGGLYEHGFDHGRRRIAGSRQTAPAVLLERWTLAKR